MGEIADALRRAREGRMPDEPAPPRPRPDDHGAARARPPEAFVPPKAVAPPQEASEPDSRKAELAPQELVTLHATDAALLLEDTPGLEACRRLAVRVRESMERRNVRSVAIVSSTRGEGKTTIACNISLALASLSPGRDVALVDLDLRKPSLARAFGLSPRIGIEQVLRGAACLEEARIAIERPPLDIYPVVDAQRAAHESLVTPAFAEALQQLEDRYHLVIFDTAPTLAVPDVSLMLRHVGACIPIARIGVTRTRVLRQLMDVLPRNKVLGPVLNGTRLSPETAYYYAEDESAGETPAAESSWRGSRSRGRKGARA
jgi:Mrp family chromosome partitioning ATPase